MPSGFHQVEHLDDVFVELRRDRVDESVLEEQGEGAAMHFGIDRILDCAATRALAVHVLLEHEAVEGLSVGLEEAVDLLVVLALEYELREDIRLRGDAVAPCEIAHDDFRGDAEHDADHQHFDGELVMLGAEVLLEARPERFRFLACCVGELTNERVHEVCLL